LGLTHEEKNLRSYQSVIILKPDLDGPQFDQAIEKIEQIFKKGGGAVIRLEKWGKKRLAYKIKKHKFGIYLNIYHSCESLKMPDMEKEYQLFDLIIKYLVIRLEEKDLERVMEENESASLEDGDIAASDAAADGEKAKLLPADVEEEK